MLSALLSMLALPLPSEFVALNTSAGFDLLADPGTLRAAYMQSINHFVSQQDGGSCFRASATIVLNALSMHGVVPPLQPGTFWQKGTPGYWVQDNVLRGTDFIESQKKQNQKYQIESSELHIMQNGYIDFKKNREQYRAARGLSEL